MGIAKRKGANNRQHTLLSALPGASMTVIKTVKIHPALGIARIGNSPTQFFIGPELPGDRTVPNGGYKDGQHRIKRQAARFRLFGYDASGRLVKELTARDGRITWTVHLANKKAAWKNFDGLNSNAPLRNAGIPDRSGLSIDPGPRSITGIDKTAAFDTGAFLGIPVPLGEIRSDSHGRLIVLGGFGHSASPSNAPITTFANNDGWHDDVSDGPVTASIVLKGTSRRVKAAGAWVICAPPKFAPPLDNAITLYDVLLQVAVDRLGLALPPQPSYTSDIYPILQRAIDMKWVSKMVSSAHAHHTCSILIPPPGSAADRIAVFARLLSPVDGSGGDMPMIWSDNYPAAGNATLTRVQYMMMQRWRDGNFINDWIGVPKPSTDITPEGLDRAALEPCVGGAFHPGIEASWLLRDAYVFDEPFRLSHSGLDAGDVTKQMAVPWQADFYDCSQEGALAWWPAQRPDDVFVSGGESQVSWTRELVGSQMGMVKKWHRLGFVVRKGSRYVETERKP